LIHESDFVGTLDRGLVVFVAASLNNASWASFAPFSRR